MNLEAIDTRVEVHLSFCCVNISEEDRLTMALLCMYNDIFRGKNNKLHCFVFKADDIVLLIITQTLE